MNKWELEVQESLIASEKEALKELEKAYKQAMLDVVTKLKTMMYDPNSKSNIYRREHLNALRQQIAAAIVNLQGNTYQTIDQFLADTYDTSYAGAMYGMGKPKGGAHLVQPINRDAAARAILTDSKIQGGLYEALGVDVDKLKKAITHEITRGIATELTYTDIARNIAEHARAPLSRAKTIARTEAHRIQQASQQDAREAAKAKGADVVKQWDATLDSGTRPTHRKLDGQTRDIDKPFEMDGKKAMYPGKFGRPEEDCNCRCVAVTRAVWALDEEELETLKERAKFFGLDKTKDFEEYKKKYLQAGETLQKTAENGIIRNDKNDLAVGLKQFGKKVGKHAKDFNLDPSSEDDRNKIFDIIQNIRNNATDERIGFWRGQPEEVLFYIKGKDVVITKQSGEFITIMKGGIENERVKNARNRKV